VVRNAADEALKTLKEEDADKARVDREARVLLAMGHVFQVGGGGVGSRGRVKGCLWVRIDIDAL
jgi:hypothetical protein